jgi:nucleoside-diphosphate-sugar epimerase
MPETIAILTGATGWLGRSLTAALLQRGRRVRCLVLPGEEVEASAEIVHGDLRSPVDCSRLLEGARDATLLHTAGVVHPARVRDFFEINARGTDNLLRAAAAAGVRRAVVVSSNSAVGMNRSRDERFDESSPYAPYLGYGRSKMQAELLAREFHRRGELEVVIVRPPWFYGPNQPRRQTLFFEMIRDGRMPIAGDGENLRSMVYVDNLCQGMLLAEGTPAAAGKTYWIADERPYSMSEIVETVARLLDRELGIPCKPPRVRLPALASAFARAADWSLQRVGLYNSKIHVLGELDRNIVCSIDRAKRELGYRPEVSLEEGMRRSIVWCREQGLLR